MIALLGLNHKTAPVQVRERFAFNTQAACETLRDLIGQELAQEAILLSTCNRVELYIAGDQLSEIHCNRLLQFLAQARSIEFDSRLSESFYFYADKDALNHLFRVVSGLDSMALGETEILGQVKDAYDLALKKCFSGRHLNKAFQVAFRTAKFIRSQTDIQKGHISIANVAVELAGKIFSGLDNCHVLVIGAGDTSEKTAKAILSRGASRLSITNRTWERSQALAEKLGGMAVEFSRWPEASPNADIIISSTSAPGYVLTRPLIEEYMKGRSSHPLLLVDIAVPRDIDPAIDALENVYLYNIDDLQAIADESRLLREKQILLCQELIDKRVEEFLDAMRKDLEYRNNLQPLSNSEISPTSHTDYAK